MELIAKQIPAGFPENPRIIGKSNIRHGNAIPVRGIPGFSRLEPDPVMFVSEHETAEMTQSHQAEQGMHEQHEHPGTIEAAFEDFQHPVP